MSVGKAPALLAAGMEAVGKGEVSAVSVLAPADYLTIANHLRRLDEMLPLFEEARDCLPVITLSQARLHGLRLDLARRMDAVGILEEWEKKQKERADG